MHPPAPPSPAARHYASKRVVCIGQSDPSAGTGIQADLKTLLSLGVYGTTVITAITAQASNGITRSLNLPADMVADQFDIVFDDLAPRVIKTGMLATSDTIDRIGACLDRVGNKAQLVVDPVMTNRAGQILLDKAAMDSLKRVIMVRADVMTPNILEAETLTGMTIRDPDAMMHAAEMMRTLGARSVIIKGGELGTGPVMDVLSDDIGTDVFEFPRLNRRLTRGAGTTLSAALAAAMASGYTVREAYIKVRRFLQQAIETGIEMKDGAGPVNHVSLIQSGTIDLFARQ